MVKKKSSKRSAKKQKTWFIKVRGSYLPNNLQGKLTYIPYLAYLMFALVVGINMSDSPLQAALLIVPNWIAAVVVMTYIASHNS